MTNFTLMACLLYVSGVTAASASFVSASPSIGAGQSNNVINLQSAISISVAEAENNDLDLRGKRIAFYKQAVDECAILEKSFDASCNIVSLNISYNRVFDQALKKPGPISQVTGFVSYRLSKRSGEKAPTP